MQAYPFRSAARRVALVALCATAACSAADAADIAGPDGGGGTPGGNPGGGNPPATAVPAELLGSWRYGSISPTNFWNDHTGVYSGNAYGMSDHYTFERDGSYTEFAYIYTQSYGCRTQVWTSIEGKVTVADGAFTEYPTKGRYKVADTCAASRNYERAMTAQEIRDRQGRTRQFQLRAEGGRTFLQILDGRYDRVQ